MTNTFDEISPITKEQTVMVDVDSSGVKHKLCMKSGYATNDRLINDSEYTIESLSKSPALVNNFKIVDDEGYVWIPMNSSTNHAAILPVEDKDDETTFNWAVCPITKSSEDYFNPENPNEKYGYKIDFDNCTLFPMMDFIEAFETFLYKNLSA